MSYHLQNYNKCTTSAVLTFLCEYIFRYFAHQTCSLWAGAGVWHQKLARIHVFILACVSGGVQ